MIYIDNIEKHLAELTKNGQDGLGLLYRFEDRSYAAPLDEFDNPCGSSRTDVHLVAYRIVKITPKRVKIVYGSKGRYINLEGRKKFACSTIADARESFLKRKEAHARILRAQLDRVTTALSLIDTKFKQPHVAAV